MKLKITKEQATDQTSLNGELNFCYRKEVKPGKEIVLLMRTQDPKFFRWGPAEKYSDTDLNLLREVYMNRFEKEKNQAFLVRRKLEQGEGQKYLSKIQEELRAEANVLYRQSLEHLGNPEIMKELDQRFASLTEKEKNFREAFSLRNAWIKRYTRKMGKTQEYFYASIFRYVKVNALITDNEWLNHPVYPRIPSRIPWDREGKRGYRPQLLVTEEDSLPYREPSLKILSYEPVIFYPESKALLPSVWLEEAEP